MNPNPLRESLRLPQTPDACTVVVFGASGDLARRKLMPALYALAAERRLPGGFAMLGVARTPLTDDAFRARMRSSVEEFSRLPLQEAEWEPFASALFYLAADYGQPESYERLKNLLGRLAGQRGTGGNVLFYMATPPSAFPEIIRGLGEAGLARPESAGGWSRIVVEKPFGHDLASARALNRLLQATFGEDQVYRIDHYLGKETVQNLLVFRFANGIFEPVWNRRYVNHVQITVAESIGVEERGSYYEEAGALRDMVQNHLMQLLALVAMEPLASFDARAVREEKVKLARAIRPITAEEAERGAVAVRGQYGPGSIAGKPVSGYRQEKGVTADSRSETFAALRLRVDNWRWSGVPFYLRSGKRLPRRVSEIAVRFRRPPVPLFRLAGGGEVDANVLAFRIQPDDGISLKFEAKLPGQELHVRSVNMEFRYGTSFGADVPEAYETLLLDAMQGDPTHYATGEMLETSWALLEPVLEAWKAAAPSNWPNYEAGSWGPAEAEALFGKDGRQKDRAWRRP